MSRRRNSSPLEDLARVASLLPWWLSTSLAAITYFTLHHFATRTPATPGSGPAGNDLSQMLISLFAGIGQYVVTSGQFTEDAQAFAQGRNIRLIDGPKLQAMLHGLTPRQSPAPSTAASAPTQANPEAAASERPASDPPGCPRCGKPMVERTARRGTKAGKTFWGCRDYPACQGARDRVS